MIDTYYVKLAAGDLVRLNGISSKVELTSSPFTAFSSLRAENATSYLSPRDVALVIALERRDARCVYVLGPTGGGWVIGAFLSHVPIETTSP